MTQLQYNDELINALAQQRQLQDKQDMLAATMGQANGWGGGLGLLGQALMGMAVGKNRNKMAENESSIERQIRDFQAQQAQALEEQAKRAQEAKYAREDAIRAEKHQQAIELQKMKATPAMQNAAAMGLQQGTPEYSDYIRKATGKAGTTVNVGDKGPQFGKIDPGYMMTQDAQGNYMQVPVPGSKAARGIETDENKAKAKIDSAIANFGNIDQVIDEAVEQSGPLSSGFIGNLTQGVGGSPAANLNATLKTIQADAAFSELQAMRDNSPTGGALGQVSERELALLTSAKAALEQSQSEEQLDKNLRRYQQVRRQAMQRVAEAYKQDYGQYPQGYKSQKEQQTSQDVRSMSDDELKRALGL